MKLDLTKNWLLWAAIPLLAILAYITVLRIGFLSDDLVLLNAAKVQGIDFGVFLPAHNSGFYRPVGTLFTWQLGWLLWGFNPLPYHAISLLLHAISALILALWLSEVTSLPILGWIGGALFAVFPLNTEAVGWIASQWDTLATAFGLSGLYLFTIWWKRSLRPATYLLSVACFGIALFSKESALTLLPIYPLSLLLMSPRPTSKNWGKLTLSLLPFGSLLALNIILRLSTWGNIGGYANLPTDYADFIWAALAKYIGILLSPLNTHILPAIYSQIMIPVLSIALLLGIGALASTYWRSLVLILTWIFLSMLPVLNLYNSAADAADLQGNRVLYLASAGYCSLLATLLFGLISAVPQRWKRPVFALPALLLLLYGITAWINLRPWHTATVISAQLNQELQALIPPQSRPQGMAWYLENVPDNYKGAYIYRLGLGNMRYFTTNGLDTPRIEPVHRASETDLTTETSDSYALRFDFDPSTIAYHLGYGVGLTHDLTMFSLPTSPTQSVWDFQGCSTRTQAAWQLEHLVSNCAPGQGLVLQPQTSDSQMITTAVNIAPGMQANTYLRLLVAVSYQPTSEVSSAPPVSQWFWKTRGSDWSSNPPISTLTKNDGNTYVYWTFIPLQTINTAITALRFDPTNTTTPFNLLWISIDTVEAK